MPRPHPNSGVPMIRSRTEGRPLGDLLPKGTLRPGDRIGTATVLSVSGPDAKARERQAKAEGKPWGRFVAGDENRVVMAFSLPPRTLWPNGRPNHFKRAKVVKEHREEACRTAADAMRAAGVTDGPWEKATLLAAFYWPNLQRRDEDGAAASLKSYRDGLVDAALLRDDSTAHLKNLPPRFDIDRKDPRVELIVERAG